MGTPEMVRPRRKSSLLASPGYKGSLITRGPSRLIKEQIEAFEAKRTNQRTRRAPERTCVIDPRTSVWIGWWDLALSLALVFTAICTPIEVGFMRIPSDRWHDPLFLLNRLVDLVFVVDMAIQFILAFPSEDPRAGSTHWVTAPSAIARHYLFSRWFVVDAFSIAVSGLDIFGEDDSEVARVTALRALRVLRMLKLVRLARGTRIFRRWENRLSINYAVLSIVNICVMLVFICHLFACAWGLQSSFDPLNTWLGQSGYCVAYNQSFPCPDGWRCDERQGWSCVGADHQYLYSLYWSIATVTSIGYGDVVATPLQLTEQLICVAMMLAGSLLFAYLVGSFCGLAANLSPDVVCFRQDLTDLNRFLSANEIPSALRYQLREYMHQSVALRRAATGNRLLVGLAPKLRNEVALQINEKWLHKIDLISDECEEGLILELAFALTLQIFPPGDVCPVGSIYIVSRGAALFAGHAYRSGQSWGEAEALLVSDRLRFPIPATAHSYLFAYSIDGEVLRLTMSQPVYPNAADRLRRRQLNWMLRRGVVRAAEEKLALRESRLTGGKGKRGSSCFFQPKHLGGSRIAVVVSEAKAAKARSKTRERPSKERMDATRTRSRSREMGQYDLSCRSPSPRSPSPPRARSSELIAHDGASAHRRAGDSSVNTSMRSDASGASSSKEAEAADSAQYGARLSRLESSMHQVKWGLDALTRSTSDDMKRLQQMVGTLLHREGTDSPRDSSRGDGRRGSRKHDKRSQEASWSIGDGSMAC